METFILYENEHQLSAIVSEEDQSIPAKSIVFPIHYAHASCFKSVEVYINNKSCTSNDTFYPYRPCLQMLLSYGKTAKKKPMKSAMFHKDKTLPDEHTCIVDVTKTIARY